LGDRHPPATIERTQAKVDANLVTIVFSGIPRRLGKSVIVGQFLKIRKIDSRIGGWRKWWSASSAVGPRGAKSQTVIQGSPGDWHFPGRSAFGTLQGV
jgi:hypothetical protein